MLAKEDEAANIVGDFLLLSQATSALVDCFVVVLDVLDDARDQAQLLLQRDDNSLHTQASLLIMIGTKLVISDDTLGDNNRLSYGLTLHDVINRADEEGHLHRLAVLLLQNLG